MSRLGRELRDPWGLLVSGVSGGMAWAVLAGSVGAAVSVPAGLAVGLGVLGAKVASGLAVRRGVSGGPDRAGSGDPPRPPFSSPAWRQLRQAEAAVDSLEKLVRRAAPGVLAEQLGSAAEQAGSTLSELRVLAARFVALEQASERADEGAPGDERQLLRARLAAAETPQIAAEMRRSVAALDDRIAVRDRLDDAAAVLHARMEAVVLGLETLVARLVEVLAMAQGTGGSDDPVAQVAAVAHELEGLRVGLSETEQISRRALDPPAGPPA